MMRDQWASRDSGAGGADDADIVAAVAGLASDVLEGVGARPKEHPQRSALAFPIRCGIAYGLTPRARGLSDRTGSRSRSIKTGRFA